MYPAGGAFYFDVSLKTAHPAVSVSLEADAKELSFVLKVFCHNPLVGANNFDFVAANTPP